MSNHHQPPPDDQSNQMDQSYNHLQPAQDNDNNGDQELQVPQICSICHNQPVNAIALDCKHIFCYLCIKSVAELSGLCPLCRAEIRPQFNFDEQQPLGAVRVPTSTEGYYWFYEGFRGWWMYDADTNQELETAFSTGVPVIQRFLAGRFYTIDVTNCKQSALNEPDGRVRAIKRERLSSDINILGMAGLKGPDFEMILNMMKEADEDKLQRAS